MENNTTPQAVPAGAQLVGTYPTLGQHISSTFGLFKKHFYEIAGVLVVIALASLGQSMMADMLKSSSESDHISALLLFNLFAGTIIATVVQFVLGYALVAYIHKREGGQQTTTTDEAISITKGIFSLIWITIIGTALTIGASFLLFIPGMLLSAVMYLALTDYIVSGRKGMRAIATAMTLLRGKFWVTLGHFLGLGVIMIVCFFLVAIALGIVATILKIPLIASIFVAILSAIFTVIVLIYVYTWYRGCVEAKKVELGSNLETAIDATFASQKKWYYLSLLSILIIPIGILSSIVLVSLSTARTKVEAQRRQQMMVEEYQRQIQIDAMQNQESPADERVPLESFEEAR